MYNSFRAIFCFTLLFLCAASTLGQSTRLEGTVVCCADCWAEADRTKVEFGTAKDLLKAQSCVAKGDPTLIAVREGDKFTLYQLEQAKFRLPGKNWLDFVGKRVAITGTVQKKKDISLVRVDALEVLAASPAEREQSAIVGKEIELALKDPFGGEQRLSSLKGRIVILNFWATYCIPCRKEMPDLAAIQNEYGAVGVQVIGASTDEPGDRDKVMQFAKEVKVNFPIWLGATTTHMIGFGLGAALPGTIIIDREGRVAKIISGVVNYPDLKKQIDLMLKGLAGAARSGAKQPKQRPEEISRGEVSSVPS